MLFTGDPADKHRREDTRTPKMGEIGDVTTLPGVPERAVPSAVDGRPVRTIERVLGHPFAFVATAVALFAIFGTAFLTQPDRVAPGVDPASYTWRAEALMSESPADVLAIEGPREIFAGTYRVSSVVVGAILRRVTDIHPFTYTIILTVGLRCLSALLLAGFAYRSRRDPLLFHAVAFGAASLFMSPPYGYLDNLLCLLFLSCALFLLAPASRSWPARAGLAMLLIASGLTHPTTLAIFVAVLILMAGARLVVREFDWRSVWRDEGAVLVVALAVLVVTYAIWKLGIWGRSVPLSEAAHPPPADRAYFLERLRLWLGTMMLPLNGPLFVIGAAGLLAAGRRAVEDDLARVSIVWLAPLAGLFGFVAGLAYPYYRFFNTTLAWALLVGTGAYFLVRFLSGRGPYLGLLGAVAVAAIFTANFASNAHLWNDPAQGWLAGDQRDDLAALKGALEESGDDRPVVFIVDTARTRPTYVYGDMKFAANVSRSGLPHGYLDRGYVYLGDVQDFLAGRPTDGSTDFYRELSADTLADAEAGIERSRREPIVVIMEALNPSAGVVADVSMPREMPAATVWVVAGGRVRDAGTNLQVLSIAPPATGWGHRLAVLFVLALILLPGFWLLRWMLPDAGLAEALGLVPGLAVAALALAGVVVLAVTRSSLTTGPAWIAVAGVVLAAGAGRMSHGRGAPA